MSTRLTFEQLARLAIEFNGFRPWAWWDDWKSRMPEDRAFVHWLDAAEDVESMATVNIFPFVNIQASIVWNKNSLPKMTEEERMVHEDLVDEIWGIIRL